MGWPVDIWASIKLQVLWAVPPNHKAFVHVLPKPFKYTHWSSFGQHINWNIGQELFRTYVKRQIDPYKVVEVTRLSIEDTLL